MCELVTVYVTRLCGIDLFPSDILVLLSRSGGVRRIGRMLYVGIVKPPSAACYM